MTRNVGRRRRRGRLLGSPGLASNALAGRREIGTRRPWWWTWVGRELRARNIEQNTRGGLYQIRVVVSRSSGLEADVGTLDPIQVIGALVQWILWQRFLFGV